MLPVLVLSIVIILSNCYPSITSPYSCHHWAGDCSDIKLDFSNKTMNDIFMTDRVPRIMQILIIDENNYTETQYNNSKYESMTTILEFKK